MPTPHLKSIVLFKKGNIWVNIKIIIGNFDNFSCHDNINCSSLMYFHPGHMENKLKNGSFLIV